MFFTSSSLLWRFPPVTANIPPLINGLLSTKAKDLIDKVTEFLNKEVLPVESSTLHDMQNKKEEEVGK